MIIDNYTPEELSSIVKQSKTYSEVIKKLGYSTAHGGNINTLKEYINKYNIDISHFSNKSKSPTKRSAENIFIENSTASQKVLRDWYKKGEYMPYVCSVCGQEPVWQEKDLTLILDHINGINNDDRIENLRWVCPNCNQQLPTTGYRKMRTENKPKKKYYCKECGAEITIGSTTGLCIECARKAIRKVERPDKEQLKQLIQTYSFTEIGKQYGVTDNTIRKWCKAVNLPSRKKDIKLLTIEDWENL